MTLRLVAPDAAWLAGRRAHVRLLVEAAAALGGRIELEERFGYLGRYHPPAGPPRPLFGQALGVNADAAVLIAADKDYTARLLASEGIATPAGRVVFAPRYAARIRLQDTTVAAGLAGVEAALSFAEERGYPVIVKPNEGSLGRGVALCEGPETLRAELARGFEADDKLRVEAYLAGAEARVVVFDGRVRLAYARRPPGVTGDGQGSVAELARAAMAGWARTARGEKIALDDPRVARCLARQGLALDAVPERGRAVRLLDSANLSLGGALDDLTGRLPPETEALALRAAAALGLRLAGVDLIAPDLACASGVHVLEVNGTPGVDYYAEHAPEAWARARALIADALAAG